LIHGRDTVGTDPRKQHGRSQSHVKEAGDTVLRLRSCYVETRALLIAVPAAVPAVRGIFNSVGIRRRFNGVGVSRRRLGRMTMLRLGSAATARDNRCYRRYKAATASTVAAMA
jgi:hypothetical protein